MHPQARFERRFYLGVSLAFLAMVLWVFARTYFLRPIFFPDALSLLQHVHGVVMTGWVVLLVVQTGLVVAHRVRWHRRLGVFGAGWAALVVIMGATMTLHAAAREVREHTARAPVQVMILGLELMQTAVFAGLVGAVIRMRRRVDVHKRLMLLSIACMLPSILARLPVSFLTNRLILMLVDAFVLGAVGIDTWRNRRLHPAFAWGGGAFLVALQVVFWASGTRTWIELGTKLVS